MQTMNFKYDFSEDLTDNERSNLIQSLIEAFCFYKGNANTFRLTSKQNNLTIWIKASKLCEKYKIQPKEFVKLAYENCKRNNQILMQYMLCGKVMENLCIEYTSRNCIKDLDKYIEDTLNFVFNLINCNKDDPLFVLKSPGFDIPAWVRIGLSNNNLEVLNMYKDKCKEEFSLHPGLKNKLKGKKFDYDKIFEA